MLLPVAALAVIQEGLEGTAVMASGTGLFTGASLSEAGGEASPALLPVGQNART